jgi:hypothetical protein
MTLITDSMLFIEVDSGAYPLYFSQIKDLLKASVSFGAGSTVEDLIAQGFQPVAESVKPEGDVLIEGTPALVDGVWTRTWTTRSFTADELAGTLSAQKTALLSQADSLQVSAFAVGFPYQFGDQVYHVQVRAGDKVNVTGQYTIAKQLIAAGQDKTFNFRVYENVSVPLNAAGMVALGDKTFQQAEAGYQVLWDFKDAVNAAATTADLPTLPTVVFSL